MRSLDFSGEPIDNISLMVAAAITKHPGLAAAAFGGTETMRAYSENRAMGMGKRQSLIHAGTSGVIESATEFIPFQQFTKLWSGRVGNSIAGRFTKYITVFKITINRSPELMLKCF